MMPARRFIHCSVDRPSIYLHTRLTTGGLNSHMDLYWLVPRGVRHPADIYTRPLCFQTAAITARKLALSSGNFLGHHQHGSKNIHGHLRRLLQL